MKSIIYILLLACILFSSVSVGGVHAANHPDEKGVISRISNLLKNEPDEQKQRYLADRQLQLGTLYTENGMYNESIECFLKADSLYTLLGDNDYRSYVLVRLYNSYHIIGNKAEYDKLRAKLLSINQDNKIVNPEISLIIMSQIGKFYEEDGNYDNAFSEYVNSFDRCKNLYGENSQKNFPICYQLASLCLKIGNTISSSTYLDCLQSICESNPEYLNEYISYILLRTEYLTQMGKVGEALALIEKPEIEVEKTDNPELQSLFYSALSGLYAALGDFEQALKYEIQSLPLCEKACGRESLQYVHALLNLGECYALNSNYSEGVKTVQNAIEIVRVKYGSEHQEYYICLRKLASLYMYLDNDRSKELRKECLILGAKLFGDNSFEHADDLMFSVEPSLAPSNDDIKILKKALDIRRNIGRNFDSFYLSNLSLYSTLLFLSQDWKLLLDTSEEILKCTKDFIILNFQKLSSSQRETLWNTIKKALDSLESYAANYSNYAVENNDYSLLADFAKIAYNARLIKKGLLLESNRSLDDLITSSSDPYVLELSNSICSLKRRLENQDTAVADIQSLKTQIYSLERELIQRVAPNGEFVDFLSIGYEDIQAALKANEVAIEFFSYIAQNHIQYGAILLSHNSDPLAFALFCEDELNKFSKGDETAYDYDNPELYRTIWSVLETFSEIRDAETIYFSADNILNTIAIESLIDSKGERATDKRKLFRLSSTREIVSQHRGNKSEQSAMLFGGLNYDAPLESSIDNSQVESNIPLIKFKKQNHTRSSRGTYEFLPGTLVEVQNISTILQEVKSEIITGERGREGTFIALNGASPTIIHLATHGFFYEPEDIEDKLLEDPTKYSFLNLSNLNKVSVETQAMRGSGLLFSGANHTLKGVNIPANIPDGVLTAEELSYLNLRQTELAVLSACETGLGASTDDGVFGLQRGFKLAGVRSILMSLWKVDDKTTAKLMQRFYENISKGINKTQALYEAQKSIRNDSKTSQPYYWAGWILLDGLN